MADPNSPTLVSPGDGSDVIGNVIVFTFTVPSDSDNDKLVFRIELDTVNPPDSGNPNYKVAESRFAHDMETYGHWEVSDGASGFVDLPTAGIGSTYYGRQAKVTLRQQDTNVFPTSETTWYWRIGAGDGMSSSPVYNQCIYAQVSYGS